MVAVRQPDEVQRGKRLLLALAALLTVVPLVAVTLLVPGVLLLEYLWGGTGAVSRAMSNWTEPSPYTNHLGFRLSLGAVAALAIGTPILVWHRVFVASGYITRLTTEGIDAGVLPVVGGYWKPAMYGAFVVGGAWVCFLGLEQGAYSAAIFFGLGAVWFGYSGVREFLAWRRKRTQGPKPPSGP